MRLFVLTRHGQSELNLTRRINGDPSVPVTLTPQGEAESTALALQIAGVELDLCVHTRFERTRRTAEIALQGRSVPLAVEPLLDDIDVGDLEGETIDDYRAWKRAHTRADAFPSGESLDDAARRYAAAFEGSCSAPSGGSSSSATRSRSAMRSTARRAPTSSTDRHMRSATAFPISSTKTGSHEQPNAFAGSCHAEGVEGGERDSNPRPPGPQPGALPTELPPPRGAQNSDELCGILAAILGTGPRSSVDRAAGFEPACGGSIPPGATLVSSGCAGESRAAGSAPAW